jgi:hypothetical protein
LARKYGVDYEVLGRGHTTNVRPAATKTKTGSTKYAVGVISTLEVRVVVFPAVRGGGLGNGLAGGPKSATAATARMTAVTIRMRPIVRDIPDRRPTDGAQLRAAGDDGPSTH